MNKTICLLSGIIIFITSCSNENEPSLDEQKFAKEYFNEDAQWYVDNIPFFECSDKQLEQVYYYRWKIYKAHIRSVGDNDFVITEFINHVAWDREPYCTINAASMLHIYEGRWLKDDLYINSYIDYLLQNGGNDRRYSESVTDAAYQNYLVNKDSAFLLKQLDSMKSIYSQWYDHYDTAKNLFYIPAMPDATEYTIASIDASGGTAGFDSGEAFRPTINSYMYANAMAIANTAKMKADNKTSKEYLQKAIDIKQRVENDLWNDSLQHFTDRFKQSNQYVHYWNFIRGRELAGLIPWNFNLPADNEKYSKAWIHAIDTNYLLGKYGFRTNEPSYEYYFKQFIYYMRQRGSQWNGPSWPYQSSLVLNAMANLLNNYHQQIVSTSDYVKSLRLFAQQHYLPNGNINLVENYDPNLGGPIVYYYWSNHYNHSCFNNLIITGLCGIRPSESDSLYINPLVDSSIKYFCLKNVNYHGHKIAVVYDADGSKYNLGKGITVFVDGNKADLSKHNNGYKTYIGKPVLQKQERRPNNIALNISRNKFPQPSASINTQPDSSMYQAIDGRIWYFTEITNRWTTLGSTSNNDWFSLNFETPKEITAVKIYTVADNKTFAPPGSINIEYLNNNKWLPVNIAEQLPATPVGNTINTLRFSKVFTSAIRINFKHTTKQVAITEIECN